MIFPEARRDVLVSYFFLRDLMHEQLPTFLDKTSKAVQRRIKYIMKNAQTVSNVHIFVGKLMFLVIRI